MKDLFLLGLLILLVSCKQDKAASDDTSNHLGNIDIQVTGTDEAIPVFEEALLLLHSFEYKDAGEKFREAQELDPEFAMAYWGEAMSLNHPLWREQEYNSAREIMAKLGEDADTQRSKFQTEFEKDMYDGLNLLYGQGSKPERDSAYSAHMKGLHEKYPENDEVAAFYALSLLGSVKGGRDYDVYEKGAVIARSVIEENPLHPGALHYLIHSYDDPQNAHKALEAANSYAKVAPDAGHALHMPSHIYVAMGMWDEVIRSNIESWEAGKMRKEEKELDNDALNYHAFQWEMYGHLQQGNYEKAEEMLSEMQGYCYELSSNRAVIHLLYLKGAYFTETNDWDNALFFDTIDYSQYPFEHETKNAYLHGLKANYNKDVATIRSMADSIAYYINENENLALIADAQMCSGSYNRNAPTKQGLDRARVLQKELEALAFVLEGDDDSAEKMFKESVELEQSTSYSFGPPQIFKPSSELYAEWLMEKGRNDEAVQQLELVLKRAPGRYIVQKHMDKLKNVI